MLIANSMDEEFLLCISTQFGFDASTSELRQRLNHVETELSIETELNTSMLNHAETELSVETRSNITNCTQPC